MTPFHPTMSFSKFSLFLLSITAMLLSANAEPAKDTRCYELRVYTAPAGKLDDLHARFRNHTVKLFEKHGMTNIGYWTPIENTENKLIYMLAYPSREAREASWKAFSADPDWQAARAESEKNGKIVEKAEGTFLSATDFSPEIKPSAAAPRVFELRTYTATPNNLDNLLKRFREHTVALFTKHGMTNFGYWTPMKDQKNADSTLVYILAHKSKPGAAAAFKEFAADPEWVAAKEASEKEGGGSLTVKPDGVKSVFMQATDYSPTK